MSELHLPQERRIDQAKLVEYLLHPEKGHGKAQLFYKFGFTMLGWVLLYDALLVHAETMPVIETVASEYGTKYIVMGGLGTPDGRDPLPLVLVVWIQDEGQDGVRFVTAYPIRS
jgi:hypothetical protein